jgi:hypothetical protein
LIADATICIGYIKIDTLDGRFMQQRTNVNTWNLINIYLAVKEGTGNTFRTLNCLARSQEVTR